MKHLKMIGSSIFQQWGIPNWQGINVQNSAIGGTTAAYWALNVKDHLSSDVRSYAVYCGSNDLNQNSPADSIIKSLTVVLDTIQASANNAQVAYFSIMKAPQKRGRFAVIDQINTAVSQLLKERDLYVDLNSIINQDSKWYTEDNLHLTKDCYLEMENKVGDSIIEWAV